MKLQLKNVSPVSEIQLSDEAFGRKYNEALVHQVVTAYMAAGRAGTKRQKSLPKFVAAGRSPGARRAPARLVPARFAAPSGWAADGRSPRGRATSRRR